MIYECEACGGEMENYANNVYYCKDCGAEGYVLNDQLFMVDDEDGEPACCIACGNPDYPKCIDGCDRIDDD